MRLRHATKDDIAQIASLHALSWRDAYRSILDPAFLAGPVESDRMAVWNARLSNPRDDQQVAVAVEQGVLVGFVCVFGDEEPKWGARVDNLHVTPSARRRGIGEMLLKSAASWVADRYPGSALHLWVFEMNALACQFYTRLGWLRRGKERMYPPISLGIRNRASTLKSEKQSSLSSKGQLCPLRVTGCPTTSGQLDAPRKRRGRAGGAHSRAVDRPVLKSINDDCSFWILMKYKGSFDVTLDDAPLG